MYGSQDCVVIYGEIELVSQGLSMFDNVCYDDDDDAYQFESILIRIFQWEYLIVSL